MQDGSGENERKRKADGYPTDLDRTNDDKRVKPSALANGPEVAKKKVNGNSSRVDRERRASSPSISDFEDATDVEGTIPSSPASNRRLGPGEPDHGRWTNNSARRTVSNNSNRDNYEYRRGSPSIADFEDDSELESGKMGRLGRDSEQPRANLKKRALEGVSGTQSSNSNSKGFKRKVRANSPTIADFRNEIEPTKLWSLKRPKQSTKGDVSEGQRVSINSERVERKPRVKSPTIADFDSDVEPTISLDPTSDSVFSRGRPKPNVSEDGPTKERRNDKSRTSEVDRRESTPTTTDSDDDIDAESRIPWSPTPERELAREETNHDPWGNDPVEGRANSSSGKYERGDNINLPGITDFENDIGLETTKARRSNSDGLEPPVHALLHTNRPLNAGNPHASQETGRVYFPRKPLNTLHTYYGGSPPAPTAKVKQKAKRKDKSYQVARTLHRDYDGTRDGLVLIADPVQLQKVAHLKEGAEEVVFRTKAQFEREFGRPPTASDMDATCTLTSFESGILQSKPRIWATIEVEKSDDWKEEYDNRDDKFAQLMSTVGQSDNSFRMRKTSRLLSMEKTKFNTPAGVRRRYRNYIEDLKAGQYNPDALIRHNNGTYRAIFLKLYQGTSDLNTFDAVTDKYGRENVWLKTIEFDYMRHTQFDQNATTFDAAEKTFCEYTEKVYQPNVFVMESGGRWVSKQAFDVVHRNDFEVDLTKLQILILGEHNRGFVQPKTLKWLNSDLYQERMRGAHLTRSDPITMEDISDILAKHRNLPSPPVLMQTTRDELRSVDEIPHDAAFFQFFPQNVSQMSTYTGNYTSSWGAIRRREELQAAFSDRDDLEGLASASSPPVRRVTDEQRRILRARSPYPERSQVLEDESLSDYDSDDAFIANDDTTHELSDGEETNNNAEREDDELATSIELEVFSSLKEAEHPIDAIPAGHDVRITDSGGSSYRLDTPPILYSFSGRETDEHKYLFLLDKTGDRYLPVVMMRDEDPELLDDRLEEAGIPPSSDETPDFAYSRHPDLLLQVSKTDFVSADSEVDQAVRVKTPLADRYEMDKIFVKCRFRNPAHEHIPIPFYTRLSSLNEPYHRIIVGAKGFGSEIIPRDAVVQLGLDTRRYAPLPPIGEEKAKDILGKLGLPTKCGSLIDKRWAPPLITRGDDEVFAGIGTKFQEKYWRIGQQTNIWRLRRIEAGVAFYRELSRQERDKLENLNSEDGAYLQSMGLKQRCPPDLTYSRRIELGYDDPPMWEWYEKLTLEQRDTLKRGIKKFGKYFCSSQPDCHSIAERDSAASLIDSGEPMTIDGTNVVTSSSSHSEIFSSEKDNRTPDIDENRPARVNSLKPISREDSVQEISAAEWGSRASGNAKRERQQLLDSGYPDDRGAPPTKRRRLDERLKDDDRGAGSHEL